MLDYTIFKAGLHGIKLILPFVDFVCVFCLSMLS